MENQYTTELDCDKYTYFVTDDLCSIISTIRYFYNKYNVKKSHNIILLHVSHIDEYNWCHKPIIIDQNMDDDNFLIMQGKAERYKHGDLNVKFIDEVLTELLIE